MIIALNLLLIYIRNDSCISFSASIFLFVDNFISIAMGTEYSFYVKSIATFALIFFGYIISVLARVKRTPLLHPLFSSIALFNVGTYLCNNCNHCAEVDFPFFRKLFFTSFSSIIIVIGGPEMAMIKRKRKEMSANSIICPI